MIEAEGGDSWGISGSTPAPGKRPPEAEINLFRKLNLQLIFIHRILIPNKVSKCKDKDNHQLYEPTESGVLAGSPSNESIDVPPWSSIGERPSNQ